MPHRKSSHKRKGGDKAFVQALHKLKSLNSTHRCQAIKLANNNFIRKFCSHVKKLKHKKIHPKYQRALSSRKATLRKLAANKTSLKAKRKILFQKGDILLFLIPLLTSAVGPLAGAVAGGIGKKIIGGVLGDE